MVERTVDCRRSGRRRRRRTTRGLRSSIVVLWRAGRNLLGRTLGSVSFLTIEDEESIGQRIMYDIKLKCVRLLYVIYVEIEYKGNESAGKRGKEVREPQNLRFACLFPRLRVGDLISRSNLKFV